MQDGQIFVRFFWGGSFQALARDSVLEWAQFEEHADQRGRQHRNIGLDAAVAEAKGALKNNQVQR